MTRMTKAMAESRFSKAEQILTICVFPIPRKVHETGRVYDADLEDISQRQEQIWEGVKEILTQLSKLS